MHDVDVVIGHGQVVGDPAGAVGAVVVGDEHVSLGHGGPQTAHDQLEVFLLVVRRDDDDDAAEVGERRLAHGRDSSIDVLGSEPTVPEVLRRNATSMSMASAPRTMSSSGHAPRRSETVIESRNGTFSTR